MTTETQTNATENTNTETNGTEAATENKPVAYLGMQGDALRAYGTEELFKADLSDATPITTAEQLIASDVPLAAIVAAFNKGAEKKVRGFKNREEGATELFALLNDLVAKQAAAAAAPAGANLAAAVKPAKAPKTPKEKKESNSEGRSSPLSGKFWARSEKPLNGRRVGGTGVGINALQYIINNPGVSTEDYLKNSEGGRFVDLQYDFDKGNIIMLEGDEAARKAEIARLTPLRAAAEKAAAEAAEKEAAEKKAKAEKLEADKKAKAEAKAKEEAEKKAAAEKEAADKAAAPAEGEAAKA